MATEQLAAYAPAPVVRYVGAPSLGAVGLGGISFGSGSILVDAALGSGVGYLIAPSGEKERYVVGGAVASGLGGLLGIGVLLACRYWRR